MAVKILAAKNLHRVTMAQFDSNPHRAFAITAQTTCSKLWSKTRTIIGKVVLRLSAALRISKPKVSLLAWKLCPPVQPLRVTLRNLLAIVIRLEYINTLSS